MFNEIERVKLAAFADELEKVAITTNPIGPGAAKYSGNMLAKLFGGGTIAAGLGAGAMMAGAPVIGGTALAGGGLAALLGLAGAAKKGITSHIANPIEKQLGNSSNMWDRVSNSWSALKGNPVKEVKEFSKGDKNKLTRQNLEQSITSGSHGLSPLELEARKHILENTADPSSKLKYMRSLNLDVTKHELDPEVIKATVNKLKGQKELEGYKSMAENLGISTKHDVHTGELVVRGGDVSKAMSGMKGLGINPYSGENLKQMAVANTGSALALGGGAALAVKGGADMLNGKDKDKENVKVVHY